MASTITTCPHCGTRNRIAASAEGVPRCGSCHRELPWIADAAQDELDEHLAVSLPVIIDFWAPWCGPCRMVTPALERIAQDHAGELKLVRVNVDDAPQAAGRFGAQSIPLLVLTRGGEEVDRMVGAVPQRQIEQWLEPHLTHAAR
jgi:thioredoxin 2